MAQDFKGRCTKPRPKPRSFDPSPEDHKSLSEIAVLVNERFERLRGVGRPELLEQALLGGTLRLMKDELRRGVYSWWIRGYCGFTCRTARRYLQRFYSYMAAKDEPVKEEPFDPDPTTEEEAQADERAKAALNWPGKG